MKQKRKIEQAELFACFQEQELPFDVTLRSRREYLRMLKRFPNEKRIQNVQKAQSNNQTKINGFIVSEALLALFICSISGFLVLASSSALSKAMQMDVQSEMDLDLDMDIEQYV